MPHGRKPTIKRCRESQATAALARDSRDSRYGKPMATPVPRRNFRLLSLEFIAVVSVVVAFVLVLRSWVRHGESGRLVRKASLAATMETHDRHLPAPAARALS